MKSILVSIIFLLAIACTEKENTPLWDKTAKEWKIKKVDRFYTDDLGKMLKGVPDFYPMYKDSKGAWWKAKYIEGDYTAEEDWFYLGNQREIIFKDSLEAVSWIKKQNSKAIIL
jgi:hypothetical protein